MGISVIVICLLFVICNLEFSSTSVSPFGRIWLLPAVFPYSLYLPVLNLSDKILLCNQLEQLLSGKLYSGAMIC